MNEQRVFTSRSPTCSHKFFIIWQFRLILFVGFDLHRHIKILHQSVMLCITLIICEISVDTTRYIMYSNYIFIRIQLHVCVYYHYKWSSPSARHFSAADSLREHSLQQCTVFPSLTFVTLLKTNIEFMNFPLSRLLRYYFIHMDSVFVLYVIFIVFLLSRPMCILSHVLSSSVNSCHWLSCCRRSL
jgi:hypothetical protein